MRTFDGSVVALDEIAMTDAGLVGGQ